MMEIYKTSEENGILTRLDTLEPGCWINLTAPSREEVEFIQSHIGIEPDFLTDPLDSEERPRIDQEENQNLIIVDIPYVYKDEKGISFETIPLGMILIDKYFITVCLKENAVTDALKEGRVKGFYTYKKTRFTFQTLFMVAKDFLRYLKYIDRQTDELEDSLSKSMRNREILKLMELERSLVFFSTSLRSNEAVMEKLTRGKVLKMYEEDEDLLEDVIIENKQAIEMAGIYSSILSNTMNAFASVISNNLNNVMKVLTAITIILSIPTMVFSFYGVNMINLPFAKSPFGWLYITLGSVLICIIATIYLYRKKLL